MPADRPGEGRLTLAKRIQRRRTKGWRMPAGALYVGRPGPFGNPFVVAPDGRVRLGPGGPAARPGGRLPPPSAPGSVPRALLAAAFEAWILAPEQAALRQRIRRELAGKDLACWCPLDQPCHADVLLRIAAGGRA